MKLSRLFPFLLILILSACNFSLAGDVTPPPGYQPPVEQVSQVEATSGPLFPLLPPDPSRGQPIYVEKCAPCHGDSGLGNGSRAAQLANPVPALSAPELARLSRPVDWYQTVTQGNLEKFMPAFKSLSDRQRWDVVAYLYSLSTTPATLLMGAEIYQANCVECHGKDGKGGMPDQASAPDLTNQELMASKSGSDLFQVIRQGAGPAMPAFADKLSLDESWALTDYLRSLTFAPASDQVAAATAVTAQETPADQLTPSVEITPTQEISSTDSLGIISGQITYEGDLQIPLGLTVTLHGFDQMQLIITRTATLQPDGVYTFPSIEMPEGRMFLSTLQFQGITYGSEVLTVEPGMTSLEMPILVYDRTSDSSILVVDRLHYFFELVDEKTLRVVELYVISNPSSKTLAAAEEGQPVLSFALPQGAANLEFQDGVLGERYLPTEDGFADTYPVRPGIGSYQVLFTYDMPYDGRLELVRPIRMPTSAVVILVPEDGLGIKGDTIQDAGVRDVQGIQYHMYNGSAMQVGQSFEISISGKQGNTDLNSSLIVGLASLGIALIIAGVWFYRRNILDKDLEPEVAPLSNANETPEAIMDAILALDDLYQEGQLPEDAYKIRRAELKARLQETMTGSTSGG
ncbi:MAG: c-type cytochrome [Anaerolineales bacterium]|nr:c-type cytochrome [Anaerolineales bacterium]